MNKIGKLKCGWCGGVVKERHFVVLTNFNTIIHDRCFLDSTESEKDFGRFKDIAQKYDFFEGLL